MPRFGLVEDDDNSETPLQYRDFHAEESFSDYSSASSYSSDEEELINGDVDDVFSLGRTRYSLETTSESMAQYRRRWGYDTELLSRAPNSKNQAQKYPPLSNYIDGSVAPTAALIRALKTPYIENEADEIDKLAGLLQAAAVIEDAAVISKQNLLVQQAQQHQQTAALQIQREIRAERLRIEQEKQEAAQGLRMLLQRNEEKAEKIRVAVRLQEEETRKQEEIEQQKAADEKREKERAQEKLRAEAEAKARAEAEAKQKAEAVPEFVARANKLRAELVKLQASVEVFDKSKVVARRRLGFKKIVNGKVNTLAENVDKIRSVAADVAAAIVQAKTEDEQNKAVPGAPPETGIGKRYLVNLLASKVIVRVQAEGFNGQRGDGFPLANMLALVSVEAKDLAPVLAAHIFTVCPTAVPTLPHPAADASEDEVMQSLGMLKLKDGQYETFERFLARTEGVISLVADIMASKPSSHTLMGGQRGGIKWLSRFLDLLPPAPQSPLPLLTSPVLDAFLTGAGHMLANKYPEEFKKCLDTITNDVVKRLDESSIGMPSAIRLKKTIEGGFGKFKTTLPSRALAELYCGASESSAGQTSSTVSSSPFASSTGPSQASPFGNAAKSKDRPPCKFFAQGRCNKGANCEFSHENPQGNATPASAPSPFGNAGAANSAFASSAAPNPFASVSSAPSPSPFGSASNPNPSPFGSASTGPFGQQPLQTSTAPAFGSPAAAPSPFGSGGAAPTPSPFGSVPVAPSNNPLGGGGFGQQQQTSTAPAFASAPVAQSPFGSGGAAPSPSPFGSGSAAPSPSPFGSAASVPAANNPFGSGGFGQQQQTQTNTATAFGSPSPASSGPFGAQPAPAPAFGGFGAAAPSPAFGAPAPATGGLFGSTPAPGPSPFSAAPAPSAFGSAVANPSPFGTAPSPFGSAQPFGQQASHFAPSSSTLNQPGGFGSQQSSGRQPCKFFAQGKCTYGNSCRFSHDTTQAVSGITAQSPSPFGSPQQPFGQQSSPFGVSSSTPNQPGFGSQNNSGRQPCSFFAQGKCRFGNSCKFSHETPQAASFGGASPFGGPRR